MDSQQILRGVESIQKLTPHRETETNITSALCYSKHAFWSAVVFLRDVTSSAASAHVVAMFIFLHSFTTFWATIHYFHLLLSLTRASSGPQISKRELLLA